MTRLSYVKCCMPNVLSAGLYLVVQAFAVQLQQGWDLGLHIHTRNNNTQTGCWVNKLQIHQQMLVAAVQRGCSSVVCAIF